MLGDRLGFYAEHGDRLTDEGEGSFVNIPLTCTDEGNKFTFRNGNVKISPTHMSADAVYMYFPYSDGIGDKDSYATAKGMELRRTKTGETAPLRCVDFLTADGLDVSDLDNGVLSGTFEHAFSEIIVMRGKGFDKPRNEAEKKITVVMKEPYSHLRINYSPVNPWGCTPELVYDNSYTRVNRDGCYRWEAWQGNNFGITSEDPEGSEAWYVLLPTLADSPTTVDYIEIYDNEGVLQRVSSLKLAGGNTKQLEAGWRYPMEITMEELVPTVNPFRVIPWNDEGDITNARTRGISTVGDFTAWLLQYNKYISGGDNEDELLKYGDRIISGPEDNKKTTWHFYIFEDLDFSNYNYTEQAADVIIAELRDGDILDGISTTLEDHIFINHKILNLTKPFVGTLGGTLQNLDFEEPYFENTAAETDDVKPVGMLANSIAGGTIDNCNIDNGTVLSYFGPVGMIAGQINGGSVINCEVSGFMIGASSYVPADSNEPKYLFGTAPQGTVTLENNISRVQFND